MEPVEMVRVPVSNKQMKSLKNLHHVLSNNVSMVYIQYNQLWDGQTDFLAQKAEQSLPILSLHAVLYST